MISILSLDPQYSNFHLNLLLPVSRCYYEDRKVDFLWCLKGFSFPERSVTAFFLLKVRQMFIFPHERLVGSLSLLLTARNLHVFMSILSSQFSKPLQGI